METGFFEIGDMLSPLGAQGVKKQLMRMPGISHVNVNYAAASATVSYDEAATNMERVREAIVRCGYHCRGELMPKHLCRKPSAAAPAAGGAHALHGQAHVHVSVKAIT